jgi:hypothetical protein
MLLLLLVVVKLLMVIEKIALFGSEPR